MKLELNLGNSMNLDDFVISEIIPKLKQYVKLNLNESLYRRINSYLKEEYKINSSAESILLYAMRTLNIRKESGVYIFEIDKYKNVPNTNINLEKIVRLINDGTLDVKGTKAITNAFNHIKSIYKQLFYVYMR